MPFACAFLAIAPSLPCEERLMYQIHIPLPARGLFLPSAALVWDEAPPASGPAATARRSAAAIRARVVVRRRARMNSRLRPPKHVTAGKAALRQGCATAHPPDGALSAGRDGQLLVSVVAGADQGAGRHRGETQVARGLLQGRELVGVPVAVDGEVLLGRAQVLADGQHLNAVVAQDR